MLDPYTYSYLNATMQRNQEAPKGYKGNYSTDLVAEKALGFLDDAAANADQPFFIGIAPIGPHGDSENLNNGSGFLPPVSAERHANMFMNVTVPRTYSFNPNVTSGASYMLGLPVQNATNLEYNDEWYRLRLRALQSVDDLVDSVVQRLDDLDLLDSTYIFYTSDNGFHIGQHRLQPGKTCPIEEDTGVPMFLRGPGIPKNQSVTVPTTHTDVIPTIFELAGINLHDDFDGTPMPTTELAIANSTGRPEHVNIEFWGVSGGEGKYGYNSYNNTYKVARVVSDSYSLFYTVWCTNEHELYDMYADPGQMNNLYGSSNQTLLGRTVEDVAARLDALVLVLKTCEGGVCIKPWHELHPAGDVVNLEQALDAKYDDFYLQEQNKVGFQACELGYIIESEQPVDWYAYDV